jgi:cell division protein FtsL
MASWAQGAARVEHAPAAPRRRAAAAKPAPRGRARAKAHPRPFGGVVWIVVLGVLFAGVVAVNVAVLQANVGLEKLGRERVQLRADTARLESQLSSATAAARIDSTARSRLGLIPADPDTTSYVQLVPSAK